jgi:hypothetical protein
MYVACHVQSTMCTVLRCLASLVLMLSVTRSVSHNQNHRPIRTLSNLPNLSSPIQTYTNKYNLIYPNLPKASDCRWGGGRGYQVTPLFVLIFHLVGLKEACVPNFSFSPLLQTCAPENFVTYCTNVGLGLASRPLVGHSSQRGSFPSI